MQYKETTVMVRLTDVPTVVFEHVVEVLHRRVGTRGYPIETINNKIYADDLALFANMSAQGKSRLYCLE